MRFLHSIVAPILLLAAGAAQAASSWGFDDAKLTVSPKKADFKEKDVRQFNDQSPLLPTPVLFDSADTLKLSFTAKGNGKPKRPHQAFFTLKNPVTGLDTAFPLTVKDNGRASVELKYTDLPIQIALATAPLKAGIILASFGPDAGLRKEIFTVQLTRDPATPPAVYEQPIRYHKLDEIHHEFRDDPQSPPIVISLVFVLAVLVTIPVLLISWLALGANLSHLPKALAAAPVAHGVFFGSIVAMEGVFFLYYSTWNLFQTLPAIGVVAILAFLSGPKALGEVQSRRLAGER
ncbi:hypothetical protein M426DRAFT_320831 [Hypoxylon sp. CI-4A]|nr:hypothetical protein M426DRAFT_320831 [Hypoxylon sp. CI-4A]